MAHAYLSYAADDEPTAAAVVAGCEAASIGLEQDRDRSRVGQTLPADVARAIDEGFAFIPLMSARLYDSPRAREELDRAIARGVPVLPVRLDEAPPPLWWEERVRGLGMIAVDDAGAYVQALVQAVGRFSDRLCPVVSMMNLKGGVGKTTMAAQVFAALQRRRKNRVLLIDLDPQHNLSQLFFRRSTQETLIYMDASAISLFEPGALQNQPSPAERWADVNMAEMSAPAPDKIARRLMPEGKAEGRFDLICGQFDVAKYAFLEDPGQIDRARSNFIQAIDALRAQYDLIVLDTNPSASFLTKCAMAVSARIVAPIRAERFSLRGVRLLHELLTRLVDEAGRPPISVVFNGVERSSVDEFEAELRSGALDPSIGFAVSRAVLKARLQASRFLAVREEGTEDDPLQHLAVYRASGIWAGALKDSLYQIGDEIATLAGVESDRRQAA